ncbi:MAG: GNAT family protein [Anaerolineales bacterium]
MYFQTEQLKLRPFESDDTPALQAYLNHPMLSGRRYIPQGFPEVVPLSTQEVESIIKKWGEEESQAHLAIVSSDKQELIGHAEIAWDWDPHASRVSVVIARPYQRQGHGSQVLSLLLEYLFENTPAHNVSSWMADWNQEARAFAKKNSFKENGHSRREGLHEGKYYDGILVDILRPEWQAIK